jgi:hypothetical protein
MRIMLKTVPAILCLASTLIARESLLRPIIITLTSATIPVNIQAIHHASRTITDENRKITCLITKSLMSRINGIIQQSRSRDVWRSSAFRRSMSAGSRWNGFDCTAEIDGEGSGSETSMSTDSTRCIRHAGQFPLVVGSTERLQLGQCFIFLANVERRRSYQRGRASDAGLSVVSRRVIETRRLVGVALARLLLVQYSTGGLGLSGSRTSRSYPFSKYEITPA